MNSVLSNCSDSLKRSPSYLNWERFHLYNRLTSNGKSKYSRAGRGQILAIAGKPIIIIIGEQISAVILLTAYFVQVREYSYNYSRVIVNFEKKSHFLTGIYFILLFILHLFLRQTLLVFFLFLFNILLIRHLLQIIAFRNLYRSSPYIYQ